MPLVMPLTDRISQASAGAQSYRWNVNSYGGGYEQRTPDGINYQTRTWTVGFEDLNATELQTVMTFLDNAGTGQYFTWTPPGYAVALKWVLEGEISINAKSGNLYVITFNCRQVYDL